MDIKDIEKFLIKVELNSDSYITGEFLYRTTHQLQLLNCMYKNGDKVVLPSVTLNTSDIKSVVKLTDTEIEAYLSLVTEKNMLHNPEQCSNCSSVNEYSGIKTIDEGFESVDEQSSEDLTMDLIQDKNSEVYVSDSSSDNTSSSVSEEENLREAFERKLALRNSTPPKEVVNDNSTLLKEVVNRSTQSGPIDLQTNNSRIKTPENEFKKVLETEQNKRQNRRRDTQNTINHKKENNERDLSRKKTYQSKSTLSKGTIVYGWKQKKYKDGFEILKAISSNFDNSFKLPEGWSNSPSVSLEEVGKNLYREGSRK